jgi:hypothetical protein
VAQTAGAAAVAVKAAVATGLIHLKGWWFGLGAAATTVASTPAGQHIVLGLRAYGLEAAAKGIPGATHLLSDPNWRTTLMTALGNASSRFTVILDGFAGSNVRQMVMNAVQRGATPAAHATEWEMAQIWAAGRIGDVTFMLKGVVMANPFK